MPQLATKLQASRPRAAQPASCQGRDLLLFSHSLAPAAAAAMLNRGSTGNRNLTCTSGGSAQLFTSMSQLHLSSCESLPAARTGAPVEPQPGACCCRSCDVQQGQHWGQEPDLRKPGSATEPNGSILHAVPWLRCGTVTTTCIACYSFVGGCSTAKQHGQLQSHSAADDCTPGSVCGLPLHRPQMSMPRPAGLSHGALALQQLVQRA